MFSFKNKLDPTLSHALLSNLYENYRVIIYCKSLEIKTIDKIKSLKCDILRHIPVSKLYLCYFNLKCYRQITRISTGIIYNF